MKNKSLNKSEGKLCGYLGVEYFRRKRKCFLWSILYTWHVWGIAGGQHEWQRIVLWQKFSPWPNSSEAPLSHLLYSPPPRPIKNRTHTDIDSNSTKLHPYDDPSLPEKTQGWQKNLLFILANNWWQMAEWELNLDMCLWVNLDGFPMHLLSHFW